MHFTISIHFRKTPVLVKLFPRLNYHLQSLWSVSASECVCVWVCVCVCVCVCVHVKHFEISEHEIVQVKFFE